MESVGSAREMRKLCRSVRNPSVGVARTASKMRPLQHLVAASILMCLMLMAASLPSVQSSTAFILQPIPLSTRSQYVHPPLHREPGVDVVLIYSSLAESRFRGDCCLSSKQLTTFLPDCSGTAACIAPRNVQVPRHLGAAQRCKMTFEGSSSSQPEPPSQNDTVSHQHIILLPPFVFLSFVPWLWRTRVTEIQISQILELGCRMRGACLRLCGVCTGARASTKTAPSATSRSRSTPWAVSLSPPFPFLFPIFPIPPLPSLKPVTQSHSSSTTPPKQAVVGGAGKMETGVVSEEKHASSAAQVCLYLS
eukprot:2795804-Rhodomonas_salina.1